MRSFKLTVAYEGTRYCGWQVQAEHATVQQAFEEALARVTGQQVRVLASGRTDAGVHALGQVVGLRVPTRLNAAVLQRALNAELPEDIAVLAAEEAPEEFHAIRDAVGKRYRYVIDNGAVRDVFARRYSWHYPQTLDVAAMQRTAEHLVGRHDFASFQSSGAPRESTVRTVYELLVERRAGRQIVIEVAADGFLYNMVRAIVGLLVEVGRGAAADGWAAEVLAARDRRAGGPTAPPQGLFLVNVDYR